VALEGHARGDVDDAPAAGALEPSGLGWREAFGDPALLALIDQALANSRDLRSATLRVAEARAAYGIQRADARPTLSLSAEAARALTPGDLNPTRQALTAGQYQAGLGLAAWELDFWGRVRSLQDSALQSYLATDAARRALTLSLVAQVAQGWLELRELDERLALAQAAVDSRNASLHIFQRRFEVGAASRLELAQVRALASQAQTLAAQLQQQRAARAHALVQLVGAPIALAAAARPLDDAAVVLPLAPGLPSELLAHRPDIAAAEHRLRAANANIGAARAAFFPRIALTASFGTASAELAGLFDGGSRAWTFAPSLTLPLFDRGRREAGLALAEVRRDLAVADYEKTIQAAFREVADALSAQRWLAEQTDSQREALQAQAERARLARLRYDAGATNFLEVLDAQRELLAAEQQLVQTRRALLAARTTLYAALGGGAATLAAAAPAP
ncbi:efflux transporter outer membrane subunit, partial [Pseudorhodoferax aquiterrae]